MFISLAQTQNPMYNLGNTHAGMQCLGRDIIAIPHTDNIHPHMTLLTFTWDSQCGNTALPIHLAALVWHLRQASIHPKCMWKATYCSPRRIVENVTYMYALIHLLWANTAQTSITCPVRYWDLVFYIVQLQENNKCFRTLINGALVLKNLTPCLSALVTSHKSAHKCETTNISVMNTVSLNTTSWWSVVPMDAARNTPETHRWILPTCIHARASHIHYSYFHYSSICTFTMSSQTYSMQHYASYR